MTPHRTRIYTASKVFRAPMWRQLATGYPDLDFSARWIHNESLDDTNVEMCRDGWIKNINDVIDSDLLICYAEADDRLSGTLVEIGAALAADNPVFLIGEYDWKTWRHHPLVEV